MKMMDNWGQREGLHCDLCGSVSPVVRCEKCNNQMFCLSCDNMYHRHPKRQSHVRKAVQTMNAPTSISTSQNQGIRPPLPPKAETLSPPVPPPRKNKRIPSVRLMGTGPFGRRDFGFMEASPQRKEWNIKEKMGNFKRLVKKRSPSPENPREEFRPIPPPISTIPRPQVAHMEANQTPYMETRFRKFSHGAMSERAVGSHRKDNIPLTVLEMSNRPKQNSRIPSSSQSVFNLSDNTPVRRYAEPEQTYPYRSRAGSFGNSEYFGNFEMYPEMVADNSDMSSIHGFATMNRPRRTPDLLRPEGFPRGGMHSSSCWDLKGASMGMPYPNMNPMMWGGFAPPHNYMGMKEGMKRVPSAMSINVPMSDDVPMMCYPPQYNMWGGPPQMYNPFGMPMFSPLGHPTNDLNLSNQSLNTRDPKKSKNSKNIPSRFRSKKKGSERLHRSLSHIPMEVNDKKSTDSEDFYSADQSEEEDRPPRSRHQHLKRAPSEPVYPANQCQYCTFINPPDCRVCKMCSKTMRPVFGDTLDEEDRDIEKELEELTPAIKSSLILGGAKKETSEISNHHEVKSSRLKKGPEVMSESTDTANNRPPSPYVGNSVPPQNAGKVDIPSPPQYVQVRSLNETRSDVDSQSVTVAQLAVSITKNSEQKTPDSVSEAPNVVNGVLTSETVSQEVLGSNPLSEPPQAPLNMPEGVSEQQVMKDDIVHIKIEGSDVNSVVKEETKHAVSVGTDASGNQPEKIIIARPYQPESNKVTTGTSPPPQSISTQTADYREMEMTRNGPHPALMSTPNILENKFPPDQNLQDLRREGMRREMQYHGDAPIRDIPFPQDSARMDIPFTNEPILRNNPFPSEQNMTGMRYSTELTPRDLKYMPQQEMEMFPYRLPEERSGFNGLEELILRRKQDDLRRQGYELTMLLRDAEMNNMSADDVEIALTHCGSTNPIRWFKENWKNLVDTVIALGNNQNVKHSDHYVGKLSPLEAEDALRRTKGNVWAAVTLAVKERQQKVAEIQSRGPFQIDEIISFLVAENGDLEKAYHNLTKDHFKPFYMKIWGPPNGVEVEGRLEHDNLDGYAHAPINASREIYALPQQEVVQQNEKSPKALLMDLDETKDIERVKQLLNKPFQSDVQRAEFNEVGLVEAAAKWQYDTSAVSTSSEQITKQQTFDGFLKSSGQPIVEPGHQSPLRSVVDTPLLTSDNNSTAISDIPQRVYVATIQAEHTDNKPEQQSTAINATPKQETSGDIKLFKVRDNTEIVQNNSESGRQVRQLLGEGKVKSYEQGEMVVKLKELDFAEDLAISASEECGSLYSAIKFLRQECEICAMFVPVKEMVSMLNCTHKCCVSCAREYFSSVLKEKNILNAVCVCCDEPDLSDLELAQEYFNHLDILLKSIVDEEVHELFHRKLRDWTLQQDPNFKWCIKCSFGFIAETNQNEVVCPNCEVSFCKKCQKLWEPQHENISCDKFQEWKAANDPERQQQGVDKQLEENGIDCPRCKFRFLLAKGGCMHFTCMQCKYEFCSGCGMPFKMGAKCGRNQYCGKLGLHAHHPRNCLFYLRDKNIEDLKELLDNHGIAYDVAFEVDAETPQRCPVQEQKEGPMGFFDDICGKPIEENQAGLCRLHFIEYLSGLINKHNLDPINIFPAGDLELILRRSDVRLPAKSPNEPEDIYRNKLLNVINDRLPLGSTEALPQLQEITPIEIAPGETAF